MENWARIIIGDSRDMVEIEDCSVDLVVTSPPYWHIKDYGVKGQIGYGQTLHEYLMDLYKVWRECYRVLKPGRRLVINIGDQFARSVIYGRYKIIPLHAEVIAQCEEIGYDYMGSIIWQKKTTMNTTGGANVMGSYPYPPNGMIEIDYEFILVFKKPGKSSAVSKDVKEKSKLSKDEWKEYFCGHWRFGGARQIGHEAMFPEELPKRIIKMYSFIGDVVLDPFLGSGTTVKVALQLNRNAIGYEINKEFVEIIREKLGIKDSLMDRIGNIEISERRSTEREIEKPLEDVRYVPRIKDAKPIIDPKKLKFENERLYKVTEVVSEDTVKLDTGLNVKLLGLRVVEREKAINYLKEKVVGKSVFIRFDGSCGKVGADTVEAYLFLRNKIFINAYLIKSGMAVPDLSRSHKYRRKFEEILRCRSKYGQRVDSECSNQQMGTQ